MQIYGILQIYSILNLSCLLFILQEGEVLEKVGMRTIKMYQVKTFCIRKLPVENLPEVVCLRVLDAESTYCFVVLWGYVMSDVVVVVLGCTGVDVNYAWRNLASCRVLKVCKVEW